MKYIQIINVRFFINVPLSRSSMSVIALQENKNTSAVVNNELIKDAKCSNS